MNQVQSLISIADDLTALFQTIVGRMAGAAASGDDGDLSSMRAESERLYTAIWEHLDHAAKQTRAAARSTDAYAGIRAGVGSGRVSLRSSPRLSASSTASVTTSSPRAARSSTTPRAWRVWVRRSRFCRVHGPRSTGPRHQHSPRSTCARGLLSRLLGRR
jgi:hypothetical protein